MAKKEERKLVLEREYTIPLRKSVAKVARYKKAKKAIKTIREFLAKHMKVPERDLTKIKIGVWLNKAVWFRGVRKPPAKIRVKAKKYSDDVVETELAELPKKAKIALEKESTEKKKVEEKKKAEEAKKKEAEEAEKKAEEGEEKKEEKERTEKLKEEERLLQKVKKTEHELIKPKKAIHRRVALEK